MTTTVSPSLDQQLADWYAGDPAALARGDQIWRTLRESSPVYHFRELDIVLVTSYELVKGLTSDNLRFSNDHSRRGSRAKAAFARLETDLERNAFSEVMEFESHFMNRNDLAEHKRLRGSAAAALTPARVKQVVDRIGQHADESLDLLEVKGGVADLRVFAHELPLRVICDLIGVPDVDRAKILEWSVALSNNRFGTRAKELVDAHAAWLEFSDYVTHLVEQYRNSVDGRDQLVTALMSAHGSETLSPDEVTSMFVMLLQGGHETTANLISLGVSELLRSPDQYAAVVRDRSKIPNAVEEMLRTVAPSQTASRRCLEDLEIGGVQVRAQQTVVAGLAAANRDPAMFVDPDRFDIDRDTARLHLSFSFGPHFCLGTSLARAEARIAVEKLVERYPRLAPTDTDLVWAGPANLRRVETLPVRLEG